MPAKTPAGFFGVVPQEPLVKSDFGRMQGVVETIRTPFYWGAIEPRRGEWDFTASDYLVGKAAERGIRVLPVLYGSPQWIAGDPAWGPATEAALRQWRAFVRAVVERYGPGGAFWQGSSRPLPIRRWQVWNEPNFVVFWRPQPDPGAYARLLEVSSRTIRAVDRRAVVVAAGLAPIEGEPPPWEFLRSMYHFRGVAQSFDVAALHPYAYTRRGVEFAVRETRSVMGAWGDGKKPLQITEIGVASGPGDGDGPGPRRQAEFLRKSLGMLIANRRRWRIAGVDWFTWQDGTASDPHCPFCEFAGLIARSGRPKPAWRAYRHLVLGSF